MSESRIVWFESVKSLIRKKAKKTKVRDAQKICFLYSQLWFLSPENSLAYKTHNVERHREPLIRGATAPAFIAAKCMSDDYSVGGRRKVVLGMSGSYRSCVHLNAGVRNTNFVARSQKIQKGISRSR